MQANLEGLLTEAANPRTAAIDSMDTDQILTTINEEDNTVAAAVACEIPQITIAVEKIVTAMARGGRLIYLGAGTSGRLGVLDAAECPPTFGVDPGRVIGLIAGGETALTQAVEGAEDDILEVVRQLEAISMNELDVVVGLAASGRTPYVIAGLEYANRLGACTVAVSCSPGSAVSKAAQVTITPLVGPEVITGSTRMKAGTAQKLVLNMLSTATMIRLGKVYGNLMVDVQPTNHKLRERSIRIVAQAAGAGREEASQALSCCDYNPKTAIVMIKRNCSAAEATDYLTAAGGFIRQALTVKLDTVGVD